MCGIAGYINLNGKKERRTFEITKMNDAQRHRGPDDSGIVGIDIEKQRVQELLPNTKYDEGFDGLLGFVRLSIQDLSIKGHQPMISNDKKVILSFNGEIYNANEYRKELIREGVLFKSTSDTEVVLYLYLKYGIDKMARKLNGMFGISIVDLRLQKMFLLRDRVGIKPLYYTFTRQRVAYSSEVKCFLALEEFEPGIRMKSVREHLTFYKPLDSVLLENVEQVKPGEIICIDLHTFELVKNKFFDIDNYNRPNESKNDISDWNKLMTEKLGECVENQKVSDAKVGCQLSGGVDSSVVTYLASHSSSNPLKDSISITFDGNELEYSEEPFVEEVRQTLNIETHKKVINADYVLNNYEKALWHADSIIGRPNAVGLMLLTQEARKYVTVLLSGEGADELLGGYLMFTQGKEVIERLKYGGEIVVESVNGQPEKIRSFAEYAVKSQQKTNTHLCKRILEGYSEKEIIEERIAQFEGYSGTNFDKQIKYSLSTYLPELLLCQDKMSMANSIENRVPFLDNDFMDFAFTIPEKYLIGEKCGSIQGKYLLKEVCAQMYGEKFSYRRKMGFGLPYYRYFKDNRFRDYFYDIIIPGTKKRGILNADELCLWYQKLGQRTWGESELFWKACSLEAWAQMFIDGRQPISI